MLPYSISIKWIDKIIKLAVYYFETSNVQHNKTLLKSNVESILKVQKCLYVKFLNATFFYLTLDFISQYLI